MPVPRRFDRRPPERDNTRINERIRVPEVRLIGEDGQQIGILKTPDALRYAQERDLDLVEVAADARPPVCRVLDYSKYRYEQAQKQKAARKHQQQITIREIKFRPKIAQNDYDTKKGHVTRFLKHKDKVKITIMFRGREVTHPERGQVLLERLAEELADLAVVEQRPIQDGRNMTMMLGPSKAVLAEAEGRQKPEKGDDASKSDAAASNGAAEAPKAETPAPEAAEAEAPKAEAPAPEAAEAEAPKAETPEAEAPAAEAPKAEEAPEAPAAEADAPEADAPEADAPEADAPDADAAADAPRAAAPRAAARAAPRRAAARAARRAAPRRAAAPARS